MNARAVVREWQPSSLMPHEQLLVVVAHLDGGARVVEECAEKRVDPSEALEVSLFSVVRVLQPRKASQQPRSVQPAVVVAAAGLNASKGIERLYERQGSTNLQQLGQPFKYARCILILQSARLLGQDGRKLSEPFAVGEITFGGGSGDA